MPSDKTVFVLVAVNGVEDETAARAAISNLSNGEQDFYPVMSEEIADEVVAEMGNPIIYFP